MNTPKEYAEELLKKFKIPMTNNIEVDKYLAKTCVNEIIAALEDYGRDNDELQNMESEWRYYDKVKEEINKIT